MNHFRRASTTANHSVALCFGASPNPTFSDLLNFWPESLKKSFGKPLCGENRVGVKWNWNAPSFSLAWLRRVCDRGAHSVRFAAHGLLALRGSFIVANERNCASLIHGAGLAGAPVSVRERPF